MASANNHIIVGLDKMSKAIQEEKLIRSEIECKSWFLNKIKKKYWAGCGTYEFPFQFSDAGTISMGECLPTDPWKGMYDKGTCKKLGRISGSLCLSEETLRCNGKISKESYVGLIGDDLSRLSQRMVRTVDNLLINDGTVTQVTANPYADGGNAAGTVTAGTVDGELYVKCPEEFQPGHVYEISSELVPTPITVYVTKVDCALHKVTFQTNAVDGTAATPADLSGYDLASAGEVIYIRPEGFKAQADCGNMFGSIEDCLFKGTTIFGIDRSLSPMLQGQVYDISATITSATALADVYKIIYKILERCGSDTMELLVPYKFFALISQELQHSKDYINRDEKAFYGYTSICYLSPRGRINITAVPKMPEDRIWFLDFDSFMWLGDLTTKDPENPGSAQPAWHRERGCGYTYFRDIFFRGKLICKAPKNSGKILIGNNYSNC